MVQTELPGRWLDPVGVERDCMVGGPGVDALHVRSPVIPPRGSRIVCRIAGLGMLSGSAGESTTSGFALELVAGEAERRRLSARLEWHRTRTAGDVERREAERVIPLDPDVVVTWGDVTGPGHLRDVSARGAAVDLAPRPPVGTPITIGLRRARVVRHTDTGVGVRFALPLREEDVTERIMLG